MNGTLASRLGRLSPALLSPQPVARSGPDCSLTQLIERIEKLRGRAQQRTAVSAGPGRALQEELGAAEVAPGLLLVERRYPLWYRHGCVALRDCYRSLPAGPQLRLEGDTDPMELVFLDTETSGLAGGTGTVAFLVGLGWLTAEGFLLRQYLMTRFCAEAPMLARLARDLAGRAGIVTYNGKSFDAPLIATRARLHGIESPISGACHIDLLHAARRRHGKLWPDCRLKTAEARALRFARRDDLPGEMAPLAWRQLVSGGHSELLPGVLRHNRDDILSLAALLTAFSDLPPTAAFNLERHGTPPHKATPGAATAPFPLQRSDGYVYDQPGFVPRWNAG